MMTNSITAASAFTGETFTPDDSDYTLNNEMATAAIRSLLARIEALEGMVAVNNITIDELQLQISALKGGSN